MARNERGASGRVEGHEGNAAVSFRHCGHRLPSRLSQSDADGSRRRRHHPDLDRAFRQADIDDAESIVPIRQQYLVAPQFDVVRPARRRECSQNIETCFTNASDNQTMRAIGCKSEIASRHNCIRNVSIRKARRDLAVR